MAKVKVIKKKRQCYAEGHGGYGTVTHSLCLHSKCKARLVYYYKFVPTACFSYKGENVEWVGIALEFCVKHNNTGNEILFPNDADKIVFGNLEQVGDNNYTVLDYCKCEYSAESENGYRIYKPLPEIYNVNIDYTICGYFKRVKGKDDIQEISAEELSDILKIIPSHFDNEDNKPVANFIVSNSVSFKEDPTFARYLINKTTKIKERLNNRKRQ